MTMLKLRLQEEDVSERKHLFCCICHEMCFFLFVPCQILRRFHGVQNASFCIQKAFLSVRTVRVRVKIHSVPLSENVIFVQKHKQY